ncbi:MAG: hypothetical protein UZ22_OP11002000522 [Microgenomates bacterium OLB23]|nr:MAG: hypothetical protein UZ22_OP11002000522 [Microgenomates bacterium OLB23]
MNDVGEYSFAPTTHLCVTRLNVHASHFTRYKSPTQKNWRVDVTLNPPGGDRGLVGGWGALVITILLSMAGSPCMLLRQIWRTGNQAEASLAHHITNLKMQCLCDPAMEMELLAFVGYHRVHCTVT